MKLTDNEIRDITKHLEAGKPLPEKYVSGRRKVAVKVVDIFGNDTMKIIEVTI